MADVKRTTRRARRAAKDQAGDAADRVKDTGEQAGDVGGDAADQAQDTARGAGEQASGVGDQARDVVKRTGVGGGGGGTPTLRSELQDTIREAAIEVLRPLARTATKSAASYAVTKGPQLLAKRVIPKIADAGGAEGIAQNVKERGSDWASKVGTAAGGVTERFGRADKDTDGAVRNARLPVMESVDIGVGLQTAYDQFTQFEDWPEFMQHVDEVEQRDDSTLMFHGRLWGLAPGWEAEIVEQAPFERIVWRGTDEGEAVVVATFHRLSDNLTRIQVDLDIQPQGLVERLSAVTRTSSRALRSDLQRLKAFLEMRDEATGGWRGRIEDAEVVEEPYDEEEPEASEEEEEPEASDEEEEPEASEEDYDEPEADAEEEEPEASEEDYEEPEADAEEEEPEASDEDEEAEQPEARADDEGEEEDEEEEPQAAPQRRTRQSPARKAPARKSPAKKAPARQSAAKKTPARQSAAKKTSARQSTAKKAPARRRTTASKGS